MGDLKQASQVLFLSLKPCKRREFEEGEISARLRRHFRVGGGEEDGFFPPGGHGRR